MEKNLYENMKGLFVKYKWRFFIGFVMVLISNCLLILNPLLFRQALMEMGPASSSGNSMMGNILRKLFGGHVHSIGVWVLLLLSIAAIAAYFKYYMRLVLIAVSRDAEMTVRAQLFSRIQSQSMAFYDRHGIGELLSRLTNDISAYRDLLGPGIIFPIYFVTLIIPAFIALYCISPVLTSISLVPLFTIPLMNMLLRHRIYGLSHLAQKGLADLSNISQEQFSGIRIVKGYAAEPSMSRSFRDLCYSLIGLNIKLNTYQGLLFPFFTMVTKIVTVTLVLFSGLIILHAWGTLSVADFVSFMWIQSYIFFPLLILAWVMPLYERGRAAYERLVEIYNEPIEVKEEGHPQHVIPALADIELRGLSFCYPTRPQPVLNNLSLVIKGGGFIGITGPLGSGKTTLFRLLNREYEIPKGKIFIGGKDIHDYPLEAFHKEMVTVEQIPFLFSRSIAENVSFGRGNASLADIEIVAKYADLHETILEFPEQYDTLIGERGVTLSGGQKQRIAIARAFLVNRSILLLDDVFSAVDAATEQRIFAAMKTHFKNKTVLLITHRASVLNVMDRVIYMVDGTIVEEGPPADLLALQGNYAALVELQRLESKKHG